MALKPCKECGKEISDSAKTCPNCGVADPGDYGTGKLIVHRRNVVVGMLVDLHISIDGVEVGILKVDQSLERELMSGTYTIQCWQSSWHKSQPFKVKVWGGYETKVDALIKFGGGLFSNPTFENPQD